MILAHFRQTLVAASMAPVSERLAPGLLVEAELGRPGRSLRWLAIQLAGPEAPHERVEAQRRYLQKVVGDPDWRPTPEKAAEIARALTIELELLLAPRPRRAGRRLGMESLERRVAGLERAVARIESRLSGEAAPQER